jgi:predicted DNA-binding antitoxin AbrB/MazE fold protein
MPKTIEAIYENGVFKPLEKIDLKEHQKVEIIIEKAESVANRSQGIVKGNPEVIEEIALSPEYTCLSLLYKLALKFTSNIAATQYIATYFV